MQRCLQVSLIARWRKSGWNSGGRSGGSRRLGWEGRGVGLNVSNEMTCFVNYERYFCPSLRPKKKLKFPPEVVIWSTLKRYFVEVVTNEYTVGVMGLVSFLLRCNGSILVLEVLKRQNLRDNLQLCISVPGTNSGTHSPALVL